jgi:multiple sugar transport system substrate-binding protein
MTRTPAAPGSNQLTRRALVGQAAAAGAGVLAAACGPVQQGGARPAGEAPAGTVTFWHWGDQTYYQRYRTLADEFQKRYPRITVETTLEPSGMEQKLIAAITAGTPPDTFVHDFQRAQGWGKQGLVEPLDDRAKKSRLLKMGEYHKIALDAITYKGKLQGLPGVGIPGGSAPMLVFYNAEHFRREGLATPYELWKRDQWTWNALIEAALKLVKRGPDGKMSQVALDWGGQQRLWMNAAGGKEVDDVFVPTKGLYDTPQATKALQFLQDLRYKHRVIPPGSMSAELGVGEDQAFLDGRLSMRIRWTTGINVYRPINNFKWGMVPYPKDATYATDYTAAGLSIAKGAKNQDAGWAWIEWASSPEGQKIDARTTTGVPFNPEAQKVFEDALKAIPMLETPEVPVELISKARYTNLRLLCVDEARLRAEAISPEMSKLWANEINGLTAGRNITQAINEFLRLNPQG